MPADVALMLVMLMRIGVQTSVVDGRPGIALRK